jgi:hypothetical protein
VHSTPCLQPWECDGLDLELRMLGLGPRRGVRRQAQPFKHRLYLLLGKVLLVLLLLLLLCTL